MKPQCPSRLLLLLLVLGANAWGGEVIRVEKSAAIISLDDGEKVEKGERLVVLDPRNGEKKGLLQINRVNGGRVYGKVLRGNIQSNDLTIPYRDRDDAEVLAKFKTTRSIKNKLGPESPPVAPSKEEEELEALLEDSPSSSPSSPTSTSAASASSRKQTKSADADEDLFFDADEISQIKRQRQQNEDHRSLSSLEKTLAEDQPAPSFLGWTDGQFGFGLGLSPVSMLVAESASQKRTLSGMNFVIRIAYDQPVFKKITITLGASLLPLTASASDATLGTAKVETMYSAFDGIAKFHFGNSHRTGYWAGGGINYLRLSSAASNVINSRSMGNRVLPQVSVGYNAQMDGEYLNYRYDLLFHNGTGGASSPVQISQSILSAIYYF